MWNDTWMGTRSHMCITEELRRAFMLHLFTDLGSKYCTGAGEILIYVALSIYA